MLAYCQGEWGTAAGFGAGPWLYHQGQDERTSQDPRWRAAAKGQEDGKLGTPLANDPKVRCAGRKPKLCILYRSIELLLSEPEGRETVRPEFLGDSYDVVKQCFLRSLASMGPWATHPMLTERMSPKQMAVYADLLGTEILSRRLLTREIDRDKYLAPARKCVKHVFLDPDTGIRLRPTKGTKAPFYLFGSELVAIAGERPELLTLNSRTSISDILGCSIKTGQ